MSLPRHQVEQLVTAHYGTINAGLPPGAPKLGIRYYQLDAWSTILARLEAGIRRQMLVMPTGTGKTVTFATLAWLLEHATGRVCSCSPTAKYSSTRR